MLNPDLIAIYIPGDPDLLLLIKKHLRRIEYPTKLNWDVRIIRPHKTKSISLKRIKTKPRNPSFDSGSRVCLLSHTKTEFMQIFESYAGSASFCVPNTWNLRMKIERASKNSIVNFPMTAFFFLPVNAIFHFSGLVD